MVTDWEWLLTQAERPGDLLLELVQKHPATAPKQLVDLVDVQQDPRHHPEGSALVHTTYVLNTMAEICDREGIKGERRANLMVAALCHDFGKATKTKWHEEKQKWVAYGHELASIPLAVSFIEQWIKFPVNLTVIRTLILHHMVHCRPSLQHTRKSATKLLSNLRPASFDDLLLLMEADCGGRPPLPAGLPESINTLIRYVEAIQDGR